MDPASLAIWAATTVINAAIQYATAPDFNTAGPRLDDTNVVGSKYGAAIPIVYGRTRIPGNIVWATPLVEQVNVSKQSAGKGSTVTTTTYSYFGTFAALLCAGDASLRPLRIWADKKLLWTAPDADVYLSGTFQGGGSWEFAPGGQAQMPSAIMQTHLGAANTPAYRYRAMLYVSGLPVDQFGRRLPQIEVEVARGAATASAVLADVISSILLSHGLTIDEIDAIAATPEFDGVAIDVGSASQIIDGLLVAQSMQMVNTGTKLAIRDIEVANVAATISSDELVADQRPLIVRRVREDALPREVRIRYLDVRRDYQISVQSASVQTGGSVNVMEVDIDAAWTATAARAACDVLLRRAVIGRVQFGPFSLPPRYLYLEPGDVIKIVAPDRTHTIRLTQVTIGANGVMQCEGEAYRASVLNGEGSGGDSGNWTPQPPVDFGTATLHVFDAPALHDETAMTAGFWWAAVGTGPSWRGCVLEMSSDGGVTWSVVAGADTWSVVGTTQTALAAPVNGAHRFDSNTVDVKIVRGALQSASRIAVLNGANMAMVGNELIQFETATLLGEKTYRLSGLLRGRRGTEHLMGSVPSGSRFILMSTANFHASGLSSIGTQKMFRVVPVGSTNSYGLEEFTIGDGTVRPWSPVHIKGERNGAGDLTVTWFLRSRIGTELPNSGAAASDEPGQRHSVEVLSGASVVRSVEVDGTSWTYTAAQQTADFGSVPPTVTVRIRRIGQLAVSSPTTKTV